MLLCSVQIISLLDIRFGCQHNFPTAILVYHGGATDHPSWRAFAIVRLVRRTIVDNSWRRMIRLLSRIYARTDYQTSYRSLPKLLPDGWSVSSINRAYIDIRNACVVLLEVKSKGELKNTRNDRTCSLILVLFVLKWLRVRPWSLFSRSLQSSLALTSTIRLNIDGAIFSYPPTVICGLYIRIPYIPSSLSTSYKHGPWQQNSLNTAYYERSRHGSAQDSVNSLAYFKAVIELK